MYQPEVVEALEGGCYIIWNPLGAASFEALDTGSRSVNPPESIGMLSESAWRQVRDSLLFSEMVDETARGTCFER